MKNLHALRERIDQIDDKILDLLNERMELVHEVGKLKNATGAPIYRPEREQAILQRLKRRSKGRLNEEAIEAIFLELFAVARNLERSEAIAYLGPEASFTHQAAEIKFGSTSRYLPISSIQGVFREVKKGAAKFGVVPIENSTNGIVSDTINSLDAYNLKIIAEVVIDVHLCFASLNEEIERIEKIYSKDIAFGQCREFLQDLGLDEVEHIPVESTAKAAKLASKEPNAAAICPTVAAKLYHLPILFEHIEDDEHNRTRFFVISDFDNAPSGKDKTSILTRLPNKPGALVSFLNDFEAANINLTKIKSHIVGGESLFFIEFDGHQSDPNVASILQRHKQIKVLGSYVKEAEDV